MARTRTSPRQTITVDAVDSIVTKLNTLGGVEFVRDAWVNKAPENYGVVELGGEIEQLWADGHLIDSIWRVVVTLYVNDDDDTRPEQVQEKLEALESGGRIELTHMASREFVYDINKVKWKWQCNLYGTLTWTENVPAENGG